ncbi:MAG: RHS repeat protein [Deltaproteobacteria bacterium]|nr:RHS repeat protein [Deltaproteobacteria bacterium]
MPKGAPILIGGPPSLDLAAAALASIRTRFVSDPLHALVSRLKPSRMRNLLHRTVCFFTGHPVDVACGKVMTECVDAELPGPLPLKIERIYSSAFAARKGPLGHGWSSSLHQAIWRERGKVVLLAEDGREIEFDTFDFPEHRIAAGQSVYNPIERLTLHCDPGEVWRVVDAEGVVRQFGPVPGRDDEIAVLYRIRSRCGFHEIGFVYDDHGQLIWVRDSCGRMIGLGHDIRGRLSSLHLPRPQGEGHYCHRRYVYDDEGDLVEVVDALGERWRFAYVTHLLTQETDRNGLSFYFAYDGLGEDAWCVRTWGDGGIYDHVLSYDKHNRATWVTDSLGHTTQYRMNLIGMVVETSDPLGGTVVREYDPHTLQETVVVDAVGGRTVRRHDAWGNLLEVVAPDGGVTSMTYSGYDRVSLRDARGGEWRWLHDAGGHLIEATSPAGRQTRWSWNAGLLVGVERGGQATVLHYDASKRLRETTVADGSTHYHHDRLGRLVAIQHPNGGVFQLAHDLEGRLVASRNAVGDEQRIVYDPEGNIVEVRDAHRRLELSYTQYHQLAARVIGGTARASATTRRADCSSSRTKPASASA